jgi:alpha-L-fucosidase
MQPEQERILRTVGAWLDKQGESIFGCRNVFPGHAEWGDAASAKGNTLYLHVDRWMGASWAFCGLANKVVSVRLLSTGQDVAFTQQDPQRLLFSGLPSGPPDPDCNVFAIATEGEPVVEPWMEG